MATDVSWNTPATGSDPLVVGACSNDRDPQLRRAVLSLVSIAAVAS